ncbi:MAG: hypothetical protein WCZ19_02140 [Acholeplasma sp.]
MEHTLRRQEVIHDNFFLYLKNNQKTMSAYAKANNLDRTLLSKWKSGASNMSPEQIHQASEYFNISVNLLYYTEKERMRHQAASEGFEPMIPQKIKLFINYKYILKKPLLLVTMMLMSFLVIALMSLVLMSYSVNFILLNLLSIGFGLFLYFNYLRRKESYILNYTDDLYYASDALKKPSMNRHIFIRIILVIIAFILFSVGALNIANLTPDEVITHGFYYVLQVYFIVFVCVATIQLPFKHKKVRYEHQFEGYQQSVFLMIISSLQFAVAVLLFITPGYFNLVLLIMSLIHFLINAIDFVLISKYYNRYEIIFDAYGSTHKKLYKD